MTLGLINMHRHLYDNYMYSGISYRGGVSSISTLLYYNFWYTYYSLKERTFTKPCNTTDELDQENSIPNNLTYTCKNTLI